MSRPRIERRLVSVGDRLRSLRAEADVCAAQLAQVADEADDTRIRALVSETPIARHEERDATRAADTLQRRHRSVLEKIARLEARQNELLDRLATGNEA